VYSLYITSRTEDVLPVETCETKWTRVHGVARFHWQYGGSAEPEYSRPLGMSWPPSRQQALTSVRVSSLLPKFEHQPPIELFVRKGHLRRYWYEIN
jgi:hypothetical protein